MSWSRFEAAAPELAAAGWSLIARDGRGKGLLATVRDDEPPRIHPISVGLVDGRLYAFINASPKRRDLQQDGRYALHAHQDPVEPAEFTLRGRAIEVTDEAVRAAVAAVWSFDADDTYGLFEFSVLAALLGRRPTADDWPPRYTSWSAEPESGARRPATSPSRPR